MRIALLSLAVWTVSGVLAQLTVDPSMTPDFYVQNVLLGGGITATNVTFNGAPGNTVDPNAQIGSFNASMANVGISNGIILATGDVNAALGPNNDGSFSLGGGFISSPGTCDPDIQQLDPTANGFNDCAVLEFDFVPTGDFVRFEFVFASEEYLEFVNSINDAFGFFISGPGINGPFTGNAQNIALVPGTTTPITINTVNDIVNPAFYVDNGDGFTAPFDSDPMFVQYDGLTTVLTAESTVSCGQSYHIKIAIADASDDVWDSAVFLAGGSFTSISVLDISLTTVSLNGQLIEGCAGGQLNLSRPDTTGDLVVNLSFSGSAQSGIDFDTIAPSITIPAGSASTSVPINATLDNMNEGVEWIVIDSWYVNSCGDTLTAVDSLQIVDYDPIVLQAGPDQFLNCDMDSVQIASVATGGVGALNYTWSNGTVGNSAMVSGLQDGTLTVTVIDDCGMSANASVNIFAGCEIEIPNVFSPNADGLNDAFVIQGITGTKNVVRIYNRWGNLMYEKANYRNTWRAEGLSDGTYYYEVVVEGKPEPYTGHLTILR